MPFVQSHRTFATTSPSSTVTRFNNLSASSWQVLESVVQTAIATAGTIGNLFMHLQTAPGAGKSWVITLRVNGVDTGLTLTIADTATEGSSVGSPVAVAVGDVVSISSTPSGTPTAMGVNHFGWEFTPTTTGESTYLSDQGGLSSTLTVQNGVFSCIGGGWTTTPANCTNVCPTTGTLNRLYVRLSGSPGAGNSYEFSVWKNSGAGFVKQDGSGGTPDTRVTISDAATTGTTTFSLSLNPGDAVYTECVPSSSPTLRSASVGYTFLASNTNEAILCGFDGNAESNVTTNLKQIEDASNWGTAETLNTTQSIVGVTATTVTKLYVLLTVAPGAGKQRVFTLRRNAGSPGGTLSVTIADTATTGNDLTNSLALTSADFWGMQTVPTGTPATTRASWGMVQTGTSLSPSEGQPWGPQVVDRVYPRRVTRAMMYGYQGPPLDPFPNTGIQVFQIPTEAVEQYAAALINSQVFQAPVEVLEQYAAATISAQVFQIAVEVIRPFACGSPPIPPVPGCPADLPLTPVAGDGCAPDNVS